MSSKALLTNAVGVHANDTEKASSSFWDKMFVKWFDRMVYPLIWEDPVSDLNALGDITGQRMVCLTSGGCNILSYLSQQPEHVAAVDLNETHLALLALKQSAIRELPYQGFFQLFAQGDVASNDALTRTLMPHLPEFAQNYWQGGRWGERRAWFNTGFYRHGLLGDFIGFGHWLARRLGYDLTCVMNAKSREEAGEIFDREIAPLFDHKIIRWLSDQVWVLYGLGIPPRQYQVLKGDAERMSDVLRDRLRHLACDYDLKDNYFAWQAFARRFNTLDQASLPIYLQAQHYDTLRQQVDNVSLHHTSVTTYLQSQDDQSVDVYVFLDAQDWMNREQINELWIEVNRTARHGARVIFRAAGPTSPLEEMLDPALLAHWKTDSDRNQVFWEQDRSAIYGGCFIYQYAI